MAWHAPNIYYLQCSCIHYQFDCYKFICIIRDSFRHIFTQMVDCWLVVVSLYSSIVFFSSLVFFCFVLFVSAYFHRVRFICTITLFRLRFRFHFNISMVDYVLERGTVVGVVVSSLLFVHNSTLFYCYVSAFRMTLINNPEDESVTWLNTRREEENEKYWKLKAFIRQRPHNATYLSVRIQRTIKPSHFTRMAHQLKKQTGRITMFTCLKEKSSTIITTATTTKTKFVYFPLENFHLRRSRKTKTKPKKNNINTNWHTVTTLVFFQKVLYDYVSGRLTANAVPTKWKKRRKRKSFPVEIRSTKSNMIIKMSVGALSLRQ